MRSTSISKSAPLLLSAVIIFVISFFIFDKFALARFLGSAYATIFDPPFTLLLVIGSLTTLKFGPFRSAVICSVVYTAITFSIIRDWQIQLGTYDGAAALLSKKLSTSTFIATVLFSIIGTLKLLFFSAFRKHQSVNTSNNSQMLFESEWRSHEGSEYTRYDASFDDAGVLSITGQDLSATAEKIWGDDEVEYFYDIPKSKQRSLAMRFLIKDPLKLVHWLSFMRPNPLLIHSLKTAFKKPKTRRNALDELKKMNTRDIAAW
jgi:hypothetical protein